MRIDSLPKYEELMKAGLTLEQSRAISLTFSNLSYEVEVLKEIYMAQERTIAGRQVMPETSTKQDIEALKVHMMCTNNNLARLDEFMHDLKSEIHSLKIFCISAWITSGLAISGYLIWHHFH